MVEQERITIVVEGALSGLQAAANAASVRLGEQLRATVQTWAVTPFWQGQMRRLSDAMLSIVGPQLEEHERRACRMVRPRRENCDD